jgi:hypothetical protein
MAVALASSSPRRSMREWAWRGGLAIGALALGYYSSTQTLAFALSKSAAERAYTLFPGDGRIAGEVAGQLLAGNPNANQRARAARIAAQALADEPLNAKALAVLAMNTQLENKTPQARRLFIHSDALSRRELVTRLWLIEDAVARENIPEALRQYDIALRTSRGASDILFPVLASAIADPAVAKALGNTLSTRPPWSEAFFNFLPSSKAAPYISAQFFARLADRGVSVPDYAQMTIVDALVSAGKLEEGWNYYASLRKGAFRNRSRDPRFSAQLTTPSTFDWMPMTSVDGVSASIQSMREGGIFEFAVPPTVGGVVLQQSQVLPAGRYRLEGISDRIEQVKDARPYWQVACSEGHEAGRVELPNSNENDGRFSGEITVGANCPFQRLRLVVRPSSEIGGAAGQIRFVQLIPLGRN